jgi:hypothetical protein
MRKTRLNIFDCDGTLIKSPLKPLPNQDHRGWNGKDWWGSRNSLISPEEGGFYDGSFNEEVLSAFRESRNDESALSVLLTGRRSPIAYLVRSILRDRGLVGKRMIDPSKLEEIARFKRLVDEGKDVDHPLSECGHLEYFTGDCICNNKIAGTFGHKKEVIERLVRDNGGYEIVEIWDDRQDHQGLFKTILRQMLQNGMVKQSIIHQVYNYPGGYANIVHEPFDLNSTW